MQAKYVYSPGEPDDVNAFPVQPAPGDEIAQLATSVPLQLSCLK